MIRNSKLQKLKLPSSDSKKLLELLKSMRKKEIQKIEDHKKSS